jgi:hypothetical protein
MQHWSIVTPADRASWDHFAIPNHTSRIVEYYRRNYHRVAAGLLITDAYPDQPAIPFPPVFRYALNDNEPNTTILDDSGFTHHGTASRNTNLDSVPGKLATAWNTNAGANTILTPSLPTPAGTLAIWFYINSLVASARTFIGIQDAAGRCYLAKTATHRLAGGLGSQGYPIIFGGDTLAALTWYHAALTWSNDDGVRLYLNAQQLYAGPKAGNIPPSALRLSAVPGYWTGVNARLDDARHYDRVLTPYQIQALYNNGDGTAALEP